MKQIHRLQASLTAVYAIAMACFFALVYPHHLHFQEQYQMFLFLWSYAADVCVVPGGVADYIGRFISQFFLYAWVGAALIMLVLTGIQQCTSRLLRGAEEGFSAWAFALSFLPSAAMWCFLCDENALMSAPVSLLIVLLAALAVRRLRPLTLRAVVAVVSIPLVYWLAGGFALVYALFLIIDILRQERSFLTASLSVGMGIVALASPAAWHHLVAFPLDLLFSGPHYFRYPALFPTWAWVAACFVPLCFVFVIALDRMLKPKSGVMPTLFAWAVAILLSGVAISQNYSQKKEVILGYDFMARTNQWNRIISTANHNAPNDQISVTALNLALSVKGLMTDHMFDYNQNGTLGLLPAFERDPVSPLVTSEAFYQLGMINTAQRYVFEAQEAIPDFQKSCRCYKRLAETNLINGSYAVARKYLQALQSTLFYKSWADETMQLLYDEEAINQHKDYGRLRTVAIESDFFYSDRDLIPMLGQLFMSNKANRLAFEYLLAACLLTKEIDMFVNCFGLNTDLKYSVIPSVYQQALLLWWSRDHSADEAIPEGINPSIVKAIQQFYMEFQSTPVNQERLKKHYGKTYWYYYFS